MHLSEWILPGGYIEADGSLHREFELSPLLGREEEYLAQLQRGHNVSSATLVNEILLRCICKLGTLKRITPEVVRGLLVADRNYLLLMLRRLTFGDRVQATLSCPWRDCNKRVDIDFNLSDIPVTGCDQLQQTYQLALPMEQHSPVTGLGLTCASELEIAFRLPNGEDQELVAPLLLENEALALSKLLQRCVSRIGAVENPDIEVISQLPGNARIEIERAMEARAPYVDLTMEIDCPECGRSFLAPFELQDFFFGELHVNSDTLYREVHYLAFHYHWSEDEIMRMPRQKRHQYINVLSDEIERLNDATH